MEIKTLGALISSPDNHDIQLGKLQPNSGYPAEFESSMGIEPLFQNGFPMCGAYAAAHLISAMETKETGKVSKISPDSIWKEIKKIDGHPAEDGTDLRSIFKATSKTGGCDYDLLPIDYGKSLSDITKYDLTKEQADNAFPRALSDKAYGVGYGIESLKKDIFLYGYGISLMKIGNTWWGKKEVYIPQEIDGGHFVMAYGYDERGVRIIDSADKYEPFKLIRNEVPIIEYRCAFDCSNLERTIMKEMIPLLKQTVELYLKLVNNIKVGNQ